ESARAELHAPLEPAQNFAARKKLRSGGSGIAEARVTDFVSEKRIFDGVVLERGAEIGVAHGAHGKAAVAIEIGSESGAEGGAVIGSGGLDEDAVNDAGGENLAVGFGVEGDAAGEAEIARAGFFESEADDAEHGGFAGVLNGERNVFVAIVDFGFGSAG